MTGNWEGKLLDQASDLTSAPYFKPAFMSLSRPHPIWTSCGSNPFECHKAVIASRMLSGRYLTDRLQRHWTQNKTGSCLLQNCIFGSEGSLEHLLLHCKALSRTRERLLSLCTRVASEHSELSRIITSALLSQDPTIIMQLLLDCSTMPDVISASQKGNNFVQDRLLYLGRTWCYNIHRERMTQLGLLKFR